MDTFQITIQPRAQKSDYYPVVVEQQFQRDIVSLRAEGHLRLSDDDIDELKTMELQPQRYGERLGAALFNVTTTEGKPSLGPVGSAFDNARAVANDRVRVFLVVEAEKLRDLRWERLCAPFSGAKTWAHLALRQQSPFSLYLPSASDLRFPPIGRHALRCLAVVASPPGLRKDLPSFDVPTVVDGIRKALSPVESDVLATATDGRVVPGANGPATLTQLATRLTDGRHTLLHLVCHGTVTTTGETVLHLADVDGGVAKVTATQLIERLQDLPRPPYFVYLSACGSASGMAEATSFGGLAQRLVRGVLGVPAVVGMTDRVEVETASARAEAFYRRLLVHGEPDRALVEAAAELKDRGDITVPVLFSRLRGLPLFSDAVDHPLSDVEITAGVDRLSPLVVERAPVLEPVFREHEATLRAALSGSAGGSSGLVVRTREEALKAIRQMCLRVVEIHFEELARSEKAPGKYDARQPFRGLEAFSIRDRPFFFGRDDEVERLRRKLETAAPLMFLPVVGASGSGKSSLVLAGLLPELRPELKPAPGLAPNGTDGSKVEVPDYPVMRPGVDPVARLKSTLATLPDVTAPLVIDQFEEVFTQTPVQGRREVLAQLFEQVLDEATRRPVILTMRVDFLGDCAPYESLRAALETYQALIAPMSAHALRRAMEDQARAVGIEFETDLANTIFDDVVREPGAMPLLQHALLELWKRRRGRWLLAEEYRAFGGVEGAIAATADKVFDELSAEDQEQVRNIFLRLTRVDEDTAPGVERRDARKRVALEALVPDGQDPAAIKALVAQLAGAALVVVTDDELEMSEGAAP